MKGMGAKLRGSRCGLTLRWLYYSAEDMLDLIRGKKHDLIPPRRLYFLTGDSDRAGYLGIGEEFLGHLKELAGLTPDSKVLEVGCGTGRMAVALTKCIGKGGSYHGFDIDPSWVKWCQRHISSRFPNFSFRYADIYNKFYNAGGEGKASEYTFPYPDGSFDLVFLTSVFTHMLPADVAHYLAEIARVVKKGGRCFSTFFLVNIGPNKNGAAGGGLRFNHQVSGYYTTDAATPEACVGYDEKFIIDLFERAGFRVQKPIYYGSWRGTPGGRSYQDIILCVKGKA